MARLFLGLDSSTQSLSASVIDLDSQSITHQESVFFDDIPGYDTDNGVLHSNKPQVMHSPPLMWVEALDLLFERLERSDVLLERIAAVAGSGQQHGSVYLNDTASQALQSLNANGTLKEQLSSIFSRSTSPIWMDSSTEVECEEIETALGGKRATAEKTGSAAFERFTGPQIRKFYKQRPEAYEQTAHIALVSSFMASIVTGNIAPIDHGDGAGMNLMDIQSRTWHPEALAATAPDLRNKLPPLVPSSSVIGTVSPYLADKYGVNPHALSLAWSGDNPNSLIGVGLVEPGMVAISLGTSDTYFGFMEECNTDPNGEGHVFGAPTGDYMSLICFKNGSLARERIRDKYGYNWEQFSAALKETPPGNNGGMMLPYFEPEIVPKVLEPGVHRYHLDESDAPANCRAVVEAQMMSMRLHSEWMGRNPSEIYATGGASANKAILQVMANVHKCPVYRSDISNSAALGAALRATRAKLKQEGIDADWTDVVAGFTDPVPDSRIEPDAEAGNLYDELIAKYADLEEDMAAR